MTIFDGKRVNSSCFVANFMREMDVRSELRHTSTEIFAVVASPFRR